MSLRRQISVLSVTALLFIVPACDTYESRIRELCRDMEWTSSEEMIEHCVLYSYRYFNQSDSGKSHRVRYELLDLDEVQKELEGVTDVYESVTNYGGDYAKYIDHFGLRKGLEHDKKILDLMLDQVRGVVIERKFQTQMGRVSSSHRAVGDQYDLKKITLYQRPSMESAFISGQIEAARAKGQLKEVEYIRITLNRELDRKDIDPDHVTDVNRFIWKPRKVDVELRGYKIITHDAPGEPKDNQDDYIEAYRVVNGICEEVPALKAFFPNRGKDVALVVIDSDAKQEGNGYGYGVPNFILEIKGVSSVTDLFSSRDIIDMMFPIKKHIERSPIKKAIQVEIARVGTDIDLWEHASTDAGWGVPFEYRNDVEDNYSIGFQYKKTDDQRGDNMRFRKVEFITKKWYGKNPGIPTPGRVVEYYRMKKEFSGNIIITIGVRDQHKHVHMILESGRIVDSYILSDDNIFTEEKPFAVAYTEGRRRWWLQRSAKSVVFNKRMEVSLEKE